MSAQAPVASPPRRQRGVISSWWHGLTLGKKLLVLSLPVLLLYDLNQVRKDLSENKSIEAASKTVFAVPGEIEARYSSCYYYDLVVCSTTPPAEKQADLPAMQGARRRRQVRLRTAKHARAAGLPLRLEPRSVRRVHRCSRFLKKSAAPAGRNEVRPGQPLARQADEGALWGSLVFCLGLSAWLAMMVWSLRRKFPGNLALFGIAVLAGPYLIEAFFWLIHVALQTAALPVQWLAARIMVTFGNLFCAVFAVSHDVKGIGEVADSIHHIAAIRRLRP